MHRPSALAAAVLIALLVQVLLVAIGATPVLQGQLIDADAYMRLAQVRHLWTTGDWFDHHLPLSNAPYGENINWTRLFDALLLSGAWVGSWFTDFESALYGWAVVISPVLLLATLLALSLALRPLVGDGGYLLAVMVMLAQPETNWIYLFGRPDHHSLMGLLFVLGLALLVRLVLDRGGRRMAFAAGLLGSLALWVSVESLLAQLFFPLALIVLWIWRRDDYLAKVAAHLGGLALGLTAVVSLEHGRELWLQPMYARVSVVHWLLAAVSALLWTGLVAADRNRRGRFDAPRARLLAAAGAAAAAGVVMLAVFPKFFAGPHAEIADIVVAWQRDNPEYEVIFPHDRESLAEFVFHLLPGLLGGAYAVWRLRRGGQAEARLMAALLVGLAVYLPIALYEIRWTSYVQFLAVVPWTLALLRLLEAARRRRALLARVAAQALVLVLGLGGHAIAAAALLPAEARLRAEDSPYSPVCAAFDELAPVLEARFAGSPILMTYYYRGAEMIWRTPLRVVGSPYMDEAGLRDTDAFFSAHDPAVPRAVAARRGIELVLTCTCCNDATTYPDPRSFHARLQRGAPPPWLERLDLPPPLDGMFQLYRVRSE